MSSADAAFTTRFGPWAVLAGASEGLGAAFARALARRGVNLVLLARRAPLLEALAVDLRRQGVQVKTAAMDLAAADLADRLGEITGGLEVGLVVYNAASAPLGAFLDQNLDEKLRALDVNCRGPVVFAHAFGKAMAARGRGGILLMSSLAGLQGTASLATYSATKAFNRTFAEALWFELRERGVDVVASCAGAISTPGFEQAASAAAPGTLTADEVAARTLAALRHGPTVVPGRVNTLAAFVMERLLPRKIAIRLMASTTRKVVPAPPRG